MKITWRHLIPFIICAGFSLGRAEAAGKIADPLSDKEMAAVKGGFCVFETCETGLPTGNCQPVPETYQGLCRRRTCFFVPWTIFGFGEIDICTLFGQYTCTETGGYRKCIMGHLYDVCWYSSDLVCGTITEPFCTENIQEKTCTCGVAETGDPCDWTNCLLESQ